MNRGTPLVETLAEVTRLTGVVQLAHLGGGEGDELDPALLLAEASDQVFTLLEQHVDPTQLVNEEDYKRVVAYRFLALVAAQGHARNEGETVDEVVARFMGLADRLFREIKPRVTQGDTPVRAGSLTPRVRNINTSQFS